MTTTQLTAPHPMLKVAPDVAEALAAGAPVVALESTIISHGMPYPHNVAMAREVEQIVRDGGAVPATIAVLNGRPTIGLDDDELAALVGHPVADTVDGVRAAADLLHARGVEHVWVRRGTRGSLLSTAGTGDASSRAVLVGAPPVDVADVTGAGDSMTAGYVHALLDGADVVEAARYGQALAALTCASADTVRADLTAALVAAHLTPTQPPIEELTR